MTVGEAVWKCCRAELVVGLCVNSWGEKMSAKLKRLGVPLRLLDAIMLTVVPAEDRSREQV